MYPWRRAIVCLSILFFGFSPVIAGPVKENKEPPLREDIGTVFVRVTVSDPMNRYVTRLKKENFKITEDRVEQEILYFEQRTAPASVGIILDTSPSMKKYMNANKVMATLARFMENSKLKGEYLLITLNQKIILEKDFNQQVPSVQDNAAFQEHGGHTAFYDAVYLGLNRVMKGINDTKALILITDGEDNSSQYPRSEVVEYAKESDVQIYGIVGQGEYNDGLVGIQKIVSITGGRAFFLKNFEDLDYWLDLIIKGLSDQYILGYKPTNPVHDGTWRRIKIELDPPKKSPKLKVHSREGYYAPKN